MLASDVANPNFAGAKDPDSALIVEFYVKPVQNNFMSSKEGRPIFEDVVYVHIMVPGDKNNDWHTPARDDHKARFPKQWQFFLNKTQGDARETGFPLMEWPSITRSQAEELRGMKFFTLESLANASDQNISAIGMVGGMAPFMLREKARAFLKAATDSAHPQHQAEELAKANAEIERLKQQVAQLASVVPQALGQVPVAAEPARRGPGRPPKQASA